MGEVLVRAFGHTVAARYLDNSEEMMRERYSHIEAGDVATDAPRSMPSIKRRFLTTTEDGIDLRLLLSQIQQNPLRAFD